MRRLILITTLCGGVLATPAIAEAKPFAARFAELKKRNSKVHITIKKSEKKLAQHAASGLTLVGNQRSDIYAPPVIEPEEISRIVRSHFNDVRGCYEKQLAENPEWTGEMILDLAVKKTGRVSEVSIAPGRVRRAPLGVCLMKKVPRWKFPRFTGETGDGVSTEVINASIPLTFDAN